MDLPLQKTHAQSKTKQVVIHLEQRLKLWLKGDINTVLVEGRAIQHLLTKSRSRSVFAGEKACIQAEVMMKENVKSALRMIYLWWCFSSPDEVLQCVILRMKYYYTVQSPTHTLRLLLSQSYRVSLVQMQQRTDSLFQSSFDLS